MYKNHSKEMKYFFNLIQIITFLDFGFNEHKSYKMKLFWKFYRMISFLSLGTYILVLLFTVIDEYFTTWGIKLLVECSFYFLILMFTPEDKTFSSYIIVLENFDKQIGVVSSSYRILLKIILYFSLGCLFDILIVCLLFLSSDGDMNMICATYALFFIHRRISGFPLKIVFFVFYSMLCRLQKLRLCIKKRKFSVFRERLMYKILIDSIENTLEPFKYIVSIRR